MRKYLLAILAVAMLSAPNTAWANGEGNGEEGPPGLRRGTVKVINKPRIIVSPRITVSPRLTTEQTQGILTIDKSKVKTGDVEVKIEGDTYRAATSSAIAAGLTSSPGACMGSTSAGVQGMSFGVSVGTTWTDPDCSRQNYAILLAKLGHPNAALTLLAKNAEVAEALTANKIDFKKIEAKVVLLDSTPSHGMDFEEISD